MSTTLERIQYGYDRDSWRTWRRRVLATGLDNYYDYDGLGQVTEASQGNLNLNLSAISGVPVAQESWAYDPTGNWESYSQLTGKQTRVHDKGNRLMQMDRPYSGTDYPIVQDACGRMTLMADGINIASKAVTWDAWNRVTAVQGYGSYAYDGLSRRNVESPAGGAATAVYYSDAWKPLQKGTVEEGTTPQEQFLWGARHRDELVRRDRAPSGSGPLTETRYVLMDYFSPAAITDETGTVTERYQFSAFGLRSILAPDFSPRYTSECAFEFAFQGQFLDPSTGLMDYGYRYYSPPLGRWLSKDPIGIQGGLNIYAFVGNAPVQATDYLGLVDDWTGKISPTTMSIIDCSSFNGSIDPSQFAQGVLSALGNGFLPDNLSAQIGMLAVDFDQLTAGGPYAFDQANSIMTIMQIDIGMNNQTFITSYMAQQAADTASLQNTLNNLNTAMRAYADVLTMGGADPVFQAPTSGGLGVVGSTGRASGEFNSDGTSSFTYSPILSSRSPSGYAGAHYSGGIGGATTSGLNASAGFGIDGVGGYLSVTADPRNFGISFDLILGAATSKFNYSIGGTTVFPK
jgi:RHS repeat-associated protein